MDNTETDPREVNRLGEAASGAFLIVATLQVRRLRGSGPAVLGKLA